MEKCNKCKVNDAHTALEVCIVCIQKALQKPDMIINDLLAYANSYRDSCGKTKLYNACLREFKDTEISVAKDLLYASYSETLGNPILRKGSRMKKKSEFELDDIFDALDELIDRKQLSVICASTNVKGIPKYNPEELEDSSMVQRIIKLEKQMEQHSARLDENFARFADTKNDLEASTRSITNIQNEVQTSIKIATEAKECADTQKK